MAEQPAQTAEDIEDVSPDIDDIVIDSDDIEYDWAEIAPNIDHIVIEDDKPVDNILSEKHQRLLTEPLYSAWAGPGADRPFMALANVGVFHTISKPPFVPDVFLSLDVESPSIEQMREKRHRTYFIWEFGKAPDVVIEIVSNRVGGEDTTKLTGYARIAIPYYIIFDPMQQVSQDVLRLYVLDVTTHQYRPKADTWLEGVGLGVTLWEGVFEGSEGIWLRWCDAEGNVIPTGAELAQAAQRYAEGESQHANAERQRADAEHQRAETAQQQADAERQRAEKLIAQLRALGIEPEDS